MLVQGVHPMFWLRDGAICFTLCPISTSRHAEYRGDKTLGVFKDHGRGSAPTIFVLELRGADRLRRDPNIELVVRGLDFEKSSV